MKDLLIADNGASLAPMLVALDAKMISLTIQK
jgi:hypothetical protein